ncbi:MAG: hypothetical protein ACT4OU_13140 [Hyphomicrobium sp.]
MTFMQATSRISILVTVLGLHAVGATDASAVSVRVKLACASDYFANCRAFRPDTPEVRRCMRGVGPRLSSRCINALASAGEISQAELRRHAAAQKRRAFALRD